MLLANIAFPIFFWLFTAIDLVYRLNPNKAHRAGAHAQRLRAELTYRCWQLCRKGEHPHKRREVRKELGDRYAAALRDAGMSQDAIESSVKDMLETWNWVERWYNEEQDDDDDPYGGITIPLARPATA